MKKILFILPFMVLSCSRNLVNMSKGEVGDTIDYDGMVLVITSQDTLNDTIYSSMDILECSIYNDLCSTIHSGANCRINNSVPLEIAKNEGNTAKVAELNKMNDEYEAKGEEAKKLLREHLEECNICKRLNNIYKDN